MQRQTFHRRVDFCRASSECMFVVLGYSFHSLVMGELSCRIDRPRSGVRERCYSNRGETRMKQLMRNMTLDLKAGAAIQRLWLVMHASLFLAVGSSYSPWHVCLVFFGTWPGSPNLTGSAARPMIAAHLGTRWKRMKGLRLSCLEFRLMCFIRKKFALHTESGFNGSPVAPVWKASHVAGGRCSRAV